MDLETILENFDAIVELPNGIEQVRSQILDLAMQGQLFQKNLIKKYSTNTSLHCYSKPFIEDQEDQEKFNKIIANHYYKIPNNWVWGKIRQLCYSVSDGTHFTPKYVSSGVPFICSKNICNGWVDFSDVKFISYEQHKELNNKHTPEYGDVLLSTIGATIGIAAEIDFHKNFSIFVGVALLKVISSTINFKFLKYALNSSCIKKISKAKKMGIIHKHFNLRDVEDIVIPVPPIKEQEIIVKKIGELTVLCDRAQQAKQARDELYKKLGSTKLLA